MPTYTIGTIYDNEPHLEPVFGALSKFAWKDYLSAAAEAEDDIRNLEVYFDGEKHTFEANVWAFEEFIQEIPSVDPMIDGDFVYLYKADEYSDEQLLAHSNSLLRAMQDDYDSLINPDQTDQSAPMMTEREAMDRVRSIAQRINDGELTIESDRLQTSKPVIVDPGVGSLVGQMKKDKPS